MSNENIVKIIQDASVDAQSLSEFMYKPADFMVERRLAPAVHTFDYYLNALDGARDNVLAELQSIKDDMRVEADNAIAQMFENGGLPATPFKTKSAMESSDLPVDSYAVVTDDSGSNGLYSRGSNGWSLSKYSPQASPVNMASGIHADSVNKSGAYLFYTASLTGEELGYPRASTGVLEVFIQSGSNYGVQRFTTGKGEVFYRYKSITWGEWVKTGFSSDELEKVTLNTDPLFYTATDLLEGTEIAGGTGINATSGSAFSQADWESSDFLPVELGDFIEVKGHMLGQVGVAGYDKDKQFKTPVFYVGRDGQSASGVYWFEVTDEAVKYIRVPNKPEVEPNFSVFKKAKVSEVAKDNSELLKGFVSGTNPIEYGYDMLEGVETHKESAILATTGYTRSGMIDYELTPFLPVSEGMKLHYTANLVSTIGMAGYDSSKRYVEALHYPSRDGYIPSTGVEIEITNPKIKYIRASHKNVIGGSEFALRARYPLTLSGATKALVSAGSEAEAPVKITFESDKVFWVHARVADGSYLSHKWEYWYREKQKEDLWVFTQTYHIGNRIAAGNFNMVHIMNDIDSTDGVNDTMFVGPSHGCETMISAVFYIDGKEFDPTTQTDELEGKVFKAQIVSNFYKPDRVKSLQEAQDNGSTATSSFATPATPLEIRSRRVSQITISDLSRIEREQKLIILKDNVQFNSLYAAMQRTYDNFIGESVYINDKDGTRNTLPDDSGEIYPIEPSTVVLENGVGYGDKNCFATRYEANGSYAGYSYNLSTYMTDVNPEHYHKIHVQMWLKQPTSSKIYFVPVYTTLLNEAYPDIEPDVFNKGDVITMNSVSEFNISVTHKEA